MKSKFGVITFAIEQIKSEEIVLREPNFTRLENTISETKKQIELGKRVVIGLIATTVTAIAAGLLVRQPKLIPVKIKKQSSR